MIPRAVYRIHITSNLYILYSMCGCNNIEFYVRFPMYARFPCHSLCIIMFPITPEVSPTPYACPSAYAYPLIYGSLTQANKPHPHPASHITTQGIGIQQHSYPSHSRHFVFPALPLSGFTIEEMVDAALEPGPLRFTGVVEDEEVHIFAWGCYSWRVGERGGKRVAYFSDLGFSVVWSWVLVLVCESVNGLDWL
jgi:hypothetical protein